MYTASDLRKGLKIEIDGEPYIVTDFDFCKPGKGQALYRCKLKNMLNDTTLDRTFRSVDKIDKPDLSQKEVFFSYKDGPLYVFMDAETYEEIRIQDTVLGDQRHFLNGDMECEMLMFQDRAVEVTLPIFVEKKIIKTEPGVRGDTATNVMKSAWVEGNYEVQVPIFLNEGDVISIDTRTGEYSERVRKA